MDQKTAWKNFKNSGKIEDYLKYKNFEDVGNKVNSGMQNSVDRDNFERITFNDQLTQGTQF